MHYILFTKIKFLLRIILLKKLRYPSGFRVDNLQGHFDSDFVITIVDIDTKMVLNLRHYINIMKLVMKICTVFYNMLLRGRCILTLGRVFLNCNGK